MSWTRRTDPGWYGSVSRYSAQDVAWLLAEPRASYLLALGSDDGEPAYRLFHEALAEHLRTRHPEFDV